MARGYLGKISAIVSANTGNYVRGLDESARRTAAFAKTIQSDLRNASRDASKSIDGILTPLQRVERALQNARSQRLSFRGFEGAIRTVEDLRKRIGSLELGDRELAVRVSGLRSVDALNKAIEGLKQEDIDLAVRVGGVDGIRRLRQEVKEVDGQVINVKTGRSAENLDFLISKFQALSAQRIQQVQIAVETAQFDRAEAAFKRTVSVAQGIAAPLGAAVQQLTTLSAGVQTAFGPALQIAQRAVDNLGKTIEANGRISDNTFDRTAQRVERTAQAINRFAEASRIASSAATGVELGFVAPRVRSELTASAAARNAAAESADPSRFAARVQQLSQVDNLVIARRAEVESIRATGGDTSRAQKQLDDLLETSRRLRASIEQELKVDVDAATAQANLDNLKKTADQLAQALNREIALTIEGPQDIEQLQAAARGLVGELGRLDAAQQSIARPRLEALSAAIATGDIDQIRTAFERAKAVIERGIAVTVDTKAAEERIAALDRRLNARLVGGLGPSVTNQQVDAEFNKLTTSLDSLSAQNQLNLDPTIQELRDAINAGENLERQLDRIVAAQERVALAAKIEALPEGSKVRQRAQEFFDRESAAPPSGPSPLGPAVDDAKKRTDLFGLPIDDSVRRLGVLQGALNSVKGQVDQLPIPLQARFVPLLSQAEAEFQRLKNSGSATAAEIAKAARNVENLKNSVTRAADAGKILSASQIRAGTDTARALGEIQAAGRLLTTINADPGDAASRAYDRLAAATRKYAREGTLGTAAVRKELQGLQIDAAKAAAATGRISFGAALKQIQRGGDVATGAVNNAGLAAQQALFIVDDFFSVTGDLSQRVRAIGNNITQLGLIIGQTQGLFIALGVSLGLQVTAQLIKFFNAGVEGADKSRALNEALQKQKTIVDQLADSFKNLSRSFTLDAFQGGARSAEEFRRQIEELRNQQREVARERTAALDPDVNRERALQQARRRDLERASNPGQVVAIQREIEQSQARERLAAARAEIRPAVTAEQVVGRLAGQVERQVETRLINQLGVGDFESGLAGADRAAAQGQAQRQAQLFAESLRAQIAAGASPETVIRQRIDELTRTRRESDLLSGEDIGLLEIQLQEAASLLVDAQKDRVRAEAEAQIAVIENLRGFGFGVSQAQASIGEAIARGVPGAIEFSRQLEESAKSVRAAEASLTSSLTDLISAEQLPQDTLDQRNARNAAINDATQRRDASRRQIEAAERQAGALIERGLGFGLQAAGRTDRAGPALQALRSSEAFANEYAGLTAQLQSAIKREEFARAANERSNTAATEAQLAAAQAATQLATAAAEAAIKINEGFDRFRSSIQAFVQQTQQAADEAQRRVNQAGGVGGPPLADLERNRDRAERNLEADQEFARGIENQLKAALAGLANDPEFQRQSARLNQLRNDAEAAAAQAIQTNVPEDPKITAGRTAEIAKAEQALDAIRKRAQEGIQKQVEAELRLKAARDRQEEFRRAEQDRRQPVGDAVRGLDIVGGARERARNELRQRQVDIEAARLGRRNLVVEGIAPGQGEDVNVARQQLEAAQQRLEQERFRQRNFANLLGPTFEVQNEAFRRNNRAEQALSAAQVFAGELPDFGTDLPGGVQSVEEAQQAIDKARELLQKVSLLGSNAKPEDFAELAKIFPETLTDVFGKVDLNNLAAESFSGFGSNTPQDAREVAAAEIARAQQELNAFVNAGRPGVEAARAEAERQEEALKKANSGLDEVLGGVGLDRQDFNLFKEDEKLAERLKAAEQAVAAAQQAFDQVNEPFANLEKNEREAAEARRRAIEDVTELGLSDQRKFARGLEDNLGLVQAQAEGFLGIGDRQAAVDSLNNAQRNLARQNAPLFAQFSDEVANAVLQGPSRAALQASDASTSEGQRELNRLLRGEDSARDVNFVELQKQSTFLQSIDTGIAGLRQQLGLAD